VPLIGAVIIPPVLCPSVIRSRRRPTAVPPTRRGRSSRFYLVGAAPSGPVVDGVLIVTGDRQSATVSGDPRLLSSAGDRLPATLGEDQSGAARVTGDRSSPTVS
jgi:hypothetical protein